MNQLLFAFKFLHFASLVAIPVGITSSAAGIKTCVITGGIKKDKSVIMKKKNKHDKIVLLGKNTLSTIENVICKALIDSHITHENFVSGNNILREYNQNERRNETSWNFCGIHYLKTMDGCRVSCKTYTAEKKIKHHKN